MRIRLVLPASLALACQAAPTADRTPSVPVQATAVIEEMRLQRRWPGSNDFLNLTLSRNGTARCKNAWPTWPVRGEHTGQLGPGDFEEVAGLIDGLGLQGLVGNLPGPVALHGSIKVEWRREGSDAFTTLECFEKSAPVALDAAALAVEAVARRVLWKPDLPVGEAREQDMPAGVPEKYAFLYGFRPEASQEQLAEALPYETIELERSGCFGSCPAFLVRFSRNGRATWEGRAFSAPAGSDTGHIALSTFARLCWLVEKLDLEQLAGRYLATWSDAQWTTIRLIKPGGELVVFHDSGRRIPIEVFALMDMIELVARQLGWAQPGPNINIRAVVTEVNRDLHTIVLDKGSEDGVQIGITLDVYRGSTYKGQVRVTGVEDETCSALIVNEKAEMVAGDLATDRL